MGRLLMWSLPALAALAWLSPAVADTLPSCPGDATVCIIAPQPALTETTHRPSQLLRDCHGAHQGGTRIDPFDYDPWSAPQRPVAHHESCLAATFLALRTWQLAAAWMSENRFGVEDGLGLRVTAPADPMAPTFTLVGVQPAKRVRPSLLHVEHPGLDPALPLNLALRFDSLGNFLDATFDQRPRAPR